MHGEEGNPSRETEQASRKVKEINNSRPRSQRKDIFRRPEEGWKCQTPQREVHGIQRLGLFPVVMANGQFRSTLAGKEAGDPITVKREVHGRQTPGPLTPELRKDRKSRPI